MKYQSYGNIQATKGQDSLRPRTIQVRHQDIRRIRLEGHAVITVVDHRILDDDVVGAVGVPAVGVLCFVVAGGLGGDGDVVVEDVVGFVDLGRWLVG